MRKLFKNKIAVIITAVLIIAAIVTAAMTPALLKHVQINDQMKIAMQYLNDLDYESAILAFTKILEIDPKNINAYVELANVYTTIGKSEEAYVILKKGYEITQDDNLAEMLAAYQEPEDIVETEQTTAIMETVDEVTTETTAPQTEAVTEPITTAAPETTAKPETTAAPETTKLLTRRIILAFRAVVAFCFTVCDTR